MEGARSRSLRLEAVPEEAESEKESKLSKVSEWLTRRPVTAPEREKCDVSVLFSIKQLQGRAVSWEGLRQALASLARPSTLAEVADTMWTMYRCVPVSSAVSRMNTNVTRDYCDTLELGLDLELEPKLQEEFPSTVCTLRSPPGTVYMWLVLDEDRMEEFWKDRGP